MPYCQNCGAEVAGNFCPNCGTKTGTVVYTAPQYVIHKDADVQPLYTTGQIVLAGYLGLGSLGVAAIMFMMGITEALEGSFGGMLAAGIIVLIFAGLAILSCLPGIRTIRKRAPEGEAKKAYRSFFVKSLLFLFMWCVTVTTFVYLFGLFFKLWRIGIWASTPNVNQYVVFKDGQKIPVTRYSDTLEGYGARGKYIYQDANGEYYRPPIA